MLFNPLLPLSAQPVFIQPENGRILATNTQPNSPKSQPKQSPKWQQLINQSKPIPLSVAVGAEGLPLTLLKKALVTWEVGTQHRVQFQLLEDAAPKAMQSADILLLWAEETALPQQEAHPSAHNTGRAWLHVKAINQSPVIVGSTIELVHYPTIDAYLSPLQQTNRLYTTLLHELGHALGLNHAKNTTSVMHPFGWKNTELTAEDSGLIFQLYGTT